MIKNLIIMLVAALVIAFVIVFSDFFQKIAEKHNQSSLGGTGTDCYVCFSLAVVTISGIFFIYNAVQVFIFVFVK